MDDQRALGDQFLALFRHQFVNQPAGRAGQFQRARGADMAEIGHLIGANVQIAVIAQGNDAAAVVQRLMRGDAQRAAVGDDAASVFQRAGLDGAQQRLIVLVDDRRHADHAIVQQLIVDADRHQARGLDAAIIGQVPGRKRQPASPEHTTLGIDDVIGPGNRQGANVDGPAIGGLPASHLQAETALGQDPAAIVEAADAQFVIAADDLAGIAQGAADPTGAVARISAAIVEIAADGELRICQRQIAAIIKRGAADRGRPLIGQDVTIGPVQDGAVRRQRQRAVAIDQPAIGQPGSGGHDDTLGPVKGAAIVDAVAAQVQPAGLQGAAVDQRPDRHRPDDTARDDRAALAQPATAGQFGISGHDIAAAGINAAAGHAQRANTFALPAIGQRPAGLHGELAGRAHRAAMAQVAGCRQQDITTRRKRTIDAGRSGAVHGDAGSHRRRIEIKPSDGRCQPQRAHSPKVATLNAQRAGADINIAAGPNRAAVQRQRVAPAPQGHIGSAGLDQAQRVAADPAGRDIQRTLGQHHGGIAGGRAAHRQPGGVDLQGPAGLNDPAVDADRIGHANHRRPGPLLGNQGGIRHCQVLRGQGQPVLRNDLRRLSHRHRLRDVQREAAALNAAGRRHVQRRTAKIEDAGRKNAGRSLQAGRTGDVQNRRRPHPGNLRVLP